MRYRRTDIELNHGCMIRETTAKAAMCRRRLSAVSTYGHCAQSRVHDSRKHRESNAKATRSNAKATRKQREHRESAANLRKCTANRRAINCCHRLVVSATPCYNADIQHNDRL